MPELTADLKLARFGQGPWVREADYYQLEAHGLICRIIRHAALGHLCGYVEAPTPLQGLHYDDVLLEDVRCHGGLTFAGHNYIEQDDSTWLLGFDCGHLGDLSPGLAGIHGRARASRDAEVREMFEQIDSLLEMFPGAQPWEVYRDVDYVAKECAELARQLYALALEMRPSHTCCSACRSTTAVRLVELGERGKRARPAVQLCGRCWAYLRAERSARHRWELLAFVKARQARTRATLVEHGLEHSNGSPVL